MRERFRPGVAIALYLAASCSRVTTAPGTQPAVDLAAIGVPPFVLGEFGGISRATLETNALPYKVVATALLLREERARGVALGRADISAIYRQFGFLYPAHLANWPAGVPVPRFERPLGMVGHTLTGPTPFIRIDAVTLGCATCHAGPVYGRDGRPTGDAWVGLPNTSIDLEAYTQAVYRAITLTVENPSAFRTRVRALFPEIGLRERFALRYVILPRVAKRMRAYAAAGDAPLPFSNGAPGITNGVASLKHIIGLPAGVVSGVADVGFTSIPDLSSRALRSSLLYDGVYAPLRAERFAPMDLARATPAHIDSLAQIVAFFTVSTMGVTPRVGEQAISAVKPVVTWIGTQYAAPPFPASIDSARMRAGEALFGQRCASCHGVYAAGTPRRLVSFPNRLVLQAAIGTDSSRWAMIDTALLRRLGTNEYARHMASSRTGGYVAPILSGIWATAPYLHNGSVPTLWQLLTPMERPTEFRLGGHALDFTDMGIAYPAGHVPWSNPVLYDTRRPGFSNRGHEAQVAGLTADERRALIEYLKTL